MNGDLPKKKVRVAAGSPHTSVQLHQLLPLVERQHRVIEELRGRAPRPLAAAALARRLGVSARTIERDVARLREAGVPVQVCHGRGGGYAIDARAALPPIVFTPGEAAALIASVAAVGPFASAAAQSSLAKLLAAFTPDQESGRTP